MTFSARSEVATVSTVRTRAVPLPDHLDDLQGPRAGRLRLPPSVYWGPEPVVDLGYPDDVAKTYEATLREGAIGDVCTVLNGALLAEVWPELVLPVPVRAAWEHRFPAHLRR